MGGQITSGIPQGFKAIGSEGSSTTATSLSRTPPPNILHQSFCSSIGMPASAATSQKGYNIAQIASSQTVKVAGGGDLQEDMIFKDSSGDQIQMVWKNGQFLPLDEETGKLLAVSGIHKTSGPTRGYGGEEGQKPVQGNVSGRFSRGRKRENVELPKEGVSGLQTNSYMNTDSTEKFICDICGPNSVACSRCLDCEENFCQACSQVHEKSKVSKKHKISDLGTLDLEMKGKIRQRVFCENHHEEEIKLVCQKCNVAICALCKVLNHDTHPLKTIADAAAEMQKSLEAKLYKCLEKQRHLDVCLQKGKELERKINDAEREEINAFEEQYSQLLRVFDEEAAKMKSKIKCIYSELRNENTAFVVDVQKETEMYSNAIENGKKLINQGSEFEKIQKGPDIERLIVEATLKTNPTPASGLERKLFSPAAIKPSELISLIGAVEDSSKLNPLGNLIMKPKSGEKVQVTLLPKSIRVGSFLGAAIDPITLSEDEIYFYMESVDGSHKFCVHPYEIIQCLSHFNPVGQSMIFFLTTSGCAVRIRKDLGIKPHTDPALQAQEPYFDPQSKEMAHQFITVVLGTVNDNSKADFTKLMELYKETQVQTLEKDDQSFYIEINEEEAYKIYEQCVY